MMNQNVGFINLKEFEVKSLLAIFLLLVYCMLPPVCELITLLASARDFVRMKFLPRRRISSSAITTTSLRFRLMLSNFFIFAHLLRVIV